MHEINHRDKYKFFVWLEGQGRFFSEEVTIELKSKGQAGVNQVNLGGRSGLEREKQTILKPKREIKERTESQTRPACLEFAEGAVLTLELANIWS